MLFRTRDESPTQQALLMAGLEAPTAAIAAPAPSHLRRAVDALGGWGHVVVFAAGMALFAGLVGFLVFFTLGKSEHAARHGATKFAGALVVGHPSAAPSGAKEYVSGVRAYFGPVSSASIYRTHNHVHDSKTDDNDDYTYYVADMLIESKRGPAVLEIDFDNHAIASDRVSSVRELEPTEAPGLSAAQRRRVAAAFAKRGGKPADEETLLSAAPSTVAPVRTVHVRVPASANAALAKATKELRCVQRAHGDVAKMQKCTQP